MEAELINLFNTHITNAPMRRSPSEGHSLESLAKIETTLFPIYKKLYDFSRSVIFYHEIDERDELMKMISDMGYHYLLVPLSLKHTPERKIPEKDDYIKIAHDEGHSGIKKLFRPIIRLIFSRMLCTTTDPCLYYFSETGR
jgi:hypothetical protein